MGGGNFIGRKSFCNLVPVPSHDQRFVNRPRNICFLRWQEVVAAQKSTRMFLKSRGQNGMLGASRSVAHVAIEPRTKSSSRSVTMFAPKRHLDDVADAVRRQ